MSIILWLTAIVLLTCSNLILWEVWKYDSKKAGEMLIVASTTAIGVTILGRIVGLIILERDR